ncbi:tetraacyldisaccharide 4'-kinase [Caminibacter mediatlanticus TB-2]|uniref:Tetraacyldisaccharide 4'-kinase n=1 Tax=Caminibacter mediatlanticus TB-2 TaxID=391592 RepID=A0AAI9AGU5_9BACT|nr:tetraacyldisaccharide 4'-kinase [Caminibacter mediatlanticus]EDM23936.1 tetraacyldisaccharide 4'-kinase [Caminibacter mediatlanticus TB-2]QCT94301.1 tetraacyldisaccharide 4'-kinase [Caminibacter mediatlanticus TB-2]
MNKIYNFFEEMLFYPKWYHYPFIILLLPFSFIYMIILHFKFPKTYEDLKIPIVSIGNIIIGGSGKTPFAISLANYLQKYKPAVVLRGYKRKSKGLIVVSDGKEILVEVEKSGDEALEIANLTKAIVIVSEDRKEAILKAKELGAGFVILDDGFDKPFKKLNIVIDITIKNPFVLPAGGYRYPRLALRYADLILKEDRDFKRKVNLPNGDILISAISKPKRLLTYWKKEYKFFPDHYNFKLKDIQKFKDKKIVTTFKDFVKLKKFNLNLDVITLKVEIKKDVLRKIEEYLIKFQQKG